MHSALHLVSHHLCPYVQRAAIVAAEKDVALERTLISLDAKPDWFLALSPTGKVPVLKVGDASIFESAVICEYLDEAYPRRLHPGDPLERARHRSWMEFASAILGDIGGLYAAPDAQVYEAKLRSLGDRFSLLEGEIAGPWFGGERFSMVDAFYGSVFRYFDVLDGYLAPAPLVGLPKVSAWRARLASRPSVKGAVAPDYGDRLTGFLAGKNSHLSRLIAGEGKKPLELLSEAQL